MSPAPRRSAWSSGIGEVDRVLGGGLVPGSIVLFGGDPGIGKSTLLLQLAAPPGGRRLRRGPVHDRRGVGVAGPRPRPSGWAPWSMAWAWWPPPSSPRRLGRSSRVSPALAVVDSVQTMASADLTGPAGSVGQVREVRHPAGGGRQGRTHLRGAGRPRHQGGHGGRAAHAGAPGRRGHLPGGERLGSTRLLRAAKNRFGSTDEVGVLEMRGDGLVEVADASRFFLESEQPPVAGSAVTIALEGTRPLAVEIQALVAPSGAGSPRRATTGIDVNRVLMLIAVLARHAGVNLTGHDVYVNVAGGLRIEEPAADLAVAVALASSLRERPVRSGTVLAGELSLAGRLRAASRAERRLAEARRLGFDRLITGPSRSTDGAAPNGLETAVDVRSALLSALAEG